MKNKIFLILFVGLMLINLISAEVETLPTVQRDTPIILTQICSNCTYVTILSVISPEYNVLLESVNMTQQGSLYTYNFTNTSLVGEYLLNGVADVDGYETPFAYNFFVTPSGFSRINSGEGIIVFAGLFIIFLIGALSFVLFLKADGFGLKITFITISAIFMLVSILFSTVLIYQNLSGFEDIIEGYDAFVFIVRAGITVLVISFFVAILLFMLKAWKLKRGDYD